MDYKPVSLEKTIARLGYSGLLPFAGLALLIWLVDTELTAFVALALAGYGAVIVSFLGGIHWGIGFKLGADAPPFHFLWGVMPSLMAWLALLMPPFAGLPLLALALGVCYAVDHKSYPSAGLSAWLPMRARLTLVAAFSCLIGAGAV
jgi:Protein of unknown function (DUF3429)